MLIFVGKTKTYLELNGKRYDATTGRVIESVASVAAGAAKLKASLNKTGQALDGFVKASPLKVVPTKIVRPPVAKKVQRQPAKPLHPKPQAAKTLMRRGLHKPSLGGLLHAKAAPVESTASPTSASSLAILAAESEERIKRAKTIHKSKLISRFGSGKLNVTTQPMAVKVPAKTKAASPRAATTVKSNPLPEPFAKALEAASAHRQPKLQKARLHHKIAKKVHLKPRTFNISALVAAAILFGGFMFYQNLPNLTVKLASARVGFNAAMPSYHPAGFALKGPIQYSPGQLTISYKSNSDNRSYEIKQQTSDWNSETLHDEYVAKNNQPYQTYQDNGRTIYISNNGANMVSENKWVQVKSDGSLNTDQLLNIVKSIP